MTKWLFLLLLIVVPVVAAQADCPALVDVAFAATNDICAGIGRNQACYGNVMLEATARDGAPALTFEQAGDIVNIADIQTLELSSMSLTDETWGIALMQLQANLPDTLPGQNVTVLLFGDVQITNDVDEVTELDVTANGGVNVRLRPRTDQNNVIASLTSGQVVTANGRLEDSSWVRIVLDADINEVGWVSADFVDGDVETLAVVEGGEPLYAPMQAFYFASSIGDSQCSEAPNSGILIQTPQGSGTINLRVNEVDIQLGSTVYMTAGGGAMTLYVVEGHAVVSAGGVSQTVPAGTFTQIPLGSNGVANGTPAFPQPYNMADVQALPVSVALPQSVSIAPPLPDDEIDAAINSADGLPASGDWLLTWLVLEDTVPCDTRDYTGDVWTANVVLDFSEDRQTLSLPNDGSGDQARVLSRIGENSYQWSDGSLTITLTFASTTAFNIRRDGQYGDPAAGGCGTFIMEGTGEYAG